jgi:hypothetical protein
MWFKRIFIPECGLESSKIELIKVKDVGNLVNRVK